MPVSDYGSTYYPPLTGGGAHVPTDMQLMAESLEGRTVMCFASGSVFNAKFATLTTAQKKGAIFFVEDQNCWYGWNGVSLTRIGGSIVTQSGVGAGFTEPTGLLIIGLPYPFASGYGYPIVVAQQRTTQLGAPVLIVRHFTDAGFEGNGHFHVMVSQSADAQPHHGYVEFTWIATGGRPGGTM